MSNLSTMDFLLKHAAADPVSFHMPGHKGSALYRRFGYGEFLDWFMDCDVTEIPGADNLFQTEGILRETQERYKRLYDAERSYMLINGTSGGILAAVLACVEENGTLVMARNCHKSVFNAMTLGNIRPAYMYPDMVEEYGVLGEISVREAERVMDENPQASAVILPSPNYYGICSDIEAIAEAAHRRDKILIVDQAHGAHLKWLSRKENGGMGPKSAEEQGADIVINSIHKTLGSFTQSAVLNLNSGRINRDILEDKLQAVQSTSPSYLLMCSLDISADLLERHGDELMRDWNANLTYFYEEAAKIPNIRLMENAEALDRSKINIDTSSLGITAAELEKRLMDRGIFSELTTGNLLMLMTGIGNQRRDFDRLLEALEKIGKASAGCRPEKGAQNGGRMPQKTEIFPVPKKKQRVKLQDAAGLICASSIIPYPPGIPLICPGEKFTQEDLAYVQSLRQTGEKVIGINEEGEVLAGI